MADLPDPEAQPPAGDLPSPAEEIFLEYLEEKDRGAATRLEDYCLRHPEFAEELRQLHEQWKAMRGLFNTSSIVVGLADQIREELGESAAPELCLTPEPAEQPSQVTELDRLFDWSGSGRYWPMGLIAKGGMGHIVKVWDRALRRHLAMKVVRRVRKGEAGSGSVKTHPNVHRFLEEAQITGQLDHPGIVPVHDLGLDGDKRPFFTMKLVKGRDLGAIFQDVFEQKDGWNLSRAVRVLLQVCETLAYAHAKGVLHRDVKPANIMVGNFGETLVMDWGLAKVLGERQDRPSDKSAGQLISLVLTDRAEQAKDQPDSEFKTLDGTIVGTPAYMSPEQACGDLDRMDARSDVYSVGALLYELLTGTMPYVPIRERRSPRLILKDVEEGPPKPIYELAPQAPVELTAIAEKAMARRRRDRYQSMRALREDLEAYLDGRVVSAHASGTWLQLRKWMQRNRGMASAFAAVILLVLTAVLGFGIIQGVHAKRLSVEKYRANVVAAEASLRDHHIGAAASLLEQAPEQHRQWEWEHLQSRLDLSQQVLPDAHQDVVRCLAVDDQNRWLASASWDGTVRLWHQNTLEHHLKFSQGRQILAAAFRPGTETLAYGGYDGQIQFRDAQSGNQLLILPVPAITEDGLVTPRPGQVASLGFSADGRFVAAGGYDGWLRIWDLESSEDPKPKPRVVGRHRSFIYGVSFEPETNAVWTSSWDRQVHRYLDWQKFDPGSITALPPDRNFRGHTGPLWDGELCPTDPKVLVTASDDWSVRIWNTEGGQPSTVLKGHNGTVTNVAFSPNGNRLATTSYDQTVRLWDRHTGRQLNVLNGHRGWIWSAVFLDEDRLVTGGSDGSIRLWDLRAPVSPVPELGDHGDWLYAVAAHPTADLLATGSLNGPITVWDLQSHEPVDVLLGHKSRVYGLAFHPKLPLLFSISNDDSVRVWNLGDETLDGIAPGDSRYLSGHGNQFAIIYRGNLAMDLEGESLYFGASDHRVVRMDRRTGESLASWDGHQQPVLCVALQPGGDLMASGSLDGTVRIWNRHERGEGQKELRLLGDPKGAFGPTLDVGFSPDGKVLAASSRDNNLIRLWRVADGRLLHTLQGHAGWVSSVQFMSDSRLASGSVDQSIRLWDTERGAQVVALYGHRHGISSLAFLPERGLLASASLDRTVRLWQREDLGLLARSQAEAKARRRTEIATIEAKLPRDLPTLEKQLEAVKKHQSFSPREKRLAAGWLRLQAKGPRR
ncbi:MAG: hypothetical protein DWQ01_13020 [Planctomycetota bacterium]|nr:MAG: hypothetical protein DWQ01_13020 [Planctomycetota bacterium]